MNEKIVELEEQLEAMPQKKLYFIYMGTFILLIFLGWNLFGKNLHSEIATKESEIKSIEDKIKKNNIRVLSQAISKTKKESLLLKEDINNLDFKEKFISSELNSVDLFNQSGIANILNSILKKSIKHNIDLDTVEYTHTNETYTPGVYEKVYINIDGSSASYINIANMIGSIDNIKSLLKVDQIDIYVDENMTTNFKIGISHIGVDI